MGAPESARREVDVGVHPERLVFRQRAEQDDLGGAVPGAQDFGGFMCQATSGLRASAPESSVTAMTR